VIDNLLGKLEYVSVRQLVTPTQESTPSPAPPGERPVSGEMPAAESAPAATRAGHTPPDSKDEPDSPPYGGQSIGRRLSVKPQLRADGERLSEATGDPTAMAGGDPAAAAPAAGTTVKRPSVDKTRKPPR
jgi:hypothetical protein